MSHYIIKLSILGAFLFLGTAAHILAAGGALDTGFNGSGKAVFNIENGPAFGSFADVATLSGGKSLVVGRVQITASYYAVTLSRFNSDGSLDTSFGAGGKIITDATITAEGITIAVQSDGKIVVVANAGNSPDRLTAVLRYTPEGVLDNSFGNNGIFFSTVMKLARDIKILADDKIIIGGDSDVPNLGRTQLLKLNANGSLDTTFGDNGIASSTYSFGSDTHKIAIQSDGKIVVSGKNLATAQKTLIHRFNANGSPDATFGTGGVLEMMGPGNTQLYLNGGLAIQPDGKIVLAGTGWTPGANNSSLLLVRLNSDGSFDNSFGTFSGTVFHDLSSHSDGAVDMLLQSDGKIAIVGQQDSQYAIMARFDSAGAIDTNFGINGIFLLFPGNNVLSIALQDSNLYATGIESSGTSFIARVNMAGADLLYRTDSFVVGKNDQARDVAVQPDGKIVTAGFSSNSNSNPVISVARLLPSGNLDTAFGNGGRVVLNDGLSQSEAYAVDIQPDGKILVAGRHSEFSIYSGSIFVVRLNADGSLDGTFGTGGKAIINLFPDLVVYDMELQTNGKIVLAGSSLRMVGDGVYNYDMMAARLNPNGSPDAGFGNNGVFTLVTGSASSPEHEQARALSIQPDGKIILAGTHLLRLNPNSTIDASFSLTPVPLPFTATDMKLQTDGKMVISGATGLDLALTRYKSDASIDTNFGNNGTAALDFGGTDGANALYLEPNGDIVAGGSTLGGNPFYKRFAIARFKPNGTPDPTFGNGGKVVTDFGGDAEIFGIARQSDGKTVAAGSAKINIDRDFAVARYFSQSTLFDFDGDNKTDISIFRASAGQWWYAKSSTGQVGVAQFGTSTDKLVPGDYTGDGKTDVTFFRPSTGEWFVLRSEDFSYYSFGYGISGDIPVTGDFDADGKADAVIYRPSSSTWYIRRSTDGGTTIQSFGQTGDAPVVADYDGDGKSDIAIYRSNGPNGAEWWIQRSSTGQVFAAQFGASTDKAVAADYTGDGKADVAVWRPSTGEWFVLRSENQSYYSFAFGITGDIPAPGDYDGDGKTDATVFRPSANTWYSQRTTAGILIQSFGQSGDLPVPNAFVP